MTLNRYTGSTNILRALPRYPNQSGGLNYQGLQAKLDQFGEEFKDWFNNTHVPQLEDDFATNDDLTNNRKLSSDGDFTGTLNGYPIVAADPGLSSIVEGHSNIIGNKGNFRASSLYNQAIFDIAASIPNNSLTQVINAISLGTLKIAFVGDSITEGYDQTNLKDTYVERFISKLKQKLPNITITYTNFALTGRVLANFNDSTYHNYATSGTDMCETRTWVTDTNKVWREYVKDYQPDLLFIAFGENDSLSQKLYGERIDKAYTDSLDTLITYVNTWSKIPSIGLITPLLRTKNTTVLQSTYGYIPSELVSKCLARATRWYALDKGYVLCDANRLWMLCRDGIDDVRRSSIWERNFEGYNTSMWGGDKTGFTLSGITLTANTTNKFITRDIDYHNGSIEMTFTPVANGSAGVMYVTVRDDADLGGILFSIKPSETNGASNGLVYLHYKTKTGTYEQIGVTSGFVINSNTNYALKLESVGSHHKVYINNTEIVEFNYYGTMHGGKVSIGSPSTCPTISGFFISIENELEDSAMYNESDLLGVAPITDKETSGDGLHHPTGLGYAVAYEPTLWGVVDELTKYNVETNWTSLTLASGITGSLYYKMSGRMVSIRGQITATTQITTNGYKLATIPTLIKPYESLPQPFKLNQIIDNSSTYGFGAIYVDGTTLGLYVHGAMTLIAANAKTLFISIEYMV